MQQNRIPAKDESDRRIGVRRRAKRGLVAGYIHEISGRHAAAAPRATQPPQPRPEPAPEPARAG
jgi:hypothetical protein